MQDTYPSQSTPSTQDKEFLPQWLNKKLFDLKDVKRFFKPSLVKVVLTIFFCYLLLYTPVGGVIAIIFWQFPVLVGSEALMIIFPIFVVFFGSSYCFSCLVIFLSRKIKELYHKIGEGKSN